MTTEQNDYAIDVAMDTYAEKSGKSVSRPWMEAAIEAYKTNSRPTDAEVEAVADVMAESEDSGSLDTARAALEAARKAGMEGKG